MGLAPAFDRISCRISQTRPSTKPSAKAVIKLASPKMAVSIKDSPFCEGTSLRRQRLPKGYSLSPTRTCESRGSTRQDFLFSIRENHSPGLDHRLGCGDARPMLGRGSHIFVKTFCIFRKIRREGAISFQSVTKSPPTFYLGCETCPNCREPVFAAEAADVTGHQVQYRWTCDLCGYRFTTEAQLDHDVAA